jgi:hypothetical protein
LMEEGQEEERTVLGPRRWTEDEERLSRQRRRWARLRELETGKIRQIGIRKPLRGTGRANRHERKILVEGVEDLGLRSKDQRQDRHQTDIDSG